MQLCAECLRSIDLGRLTLLLWVTCDHEGARAGFGGWHQKPRGEAALGISLQLPVAVSRLLARRSGGCRRSLSGKLSWPPEKQEEPGPLNVQSPAHLWWEDAFKGAGSCS